MQTTLDGWGRSVDDFFVNRNELYDEFFSALRSTAFATAEDFFADCDTGFTFEGGEGDLLTIPGPLANDPICGPWQEMTDTRDELSLTQNPASLAAQ